VAVGISGVPEDLFAATSTLTDGRMYPPDDRFEINSGCPSVRVFKHVRHRTSIGANGALKIATSDGTVHLDLAGADGKTVACLLSETNYECH
jgi:hypothetical protein